MPATNESDVEPRQFADRWSKDLVGTAEVPTTSGFNLGRALLYGDGVQGAPGSHRPGSPLRDLGPRRTQPRRRDHRPGTGSGRLRRPRRRALRSPHDRRARPGGVLPRGSLAAKGPTRRAGSGFSTSDRQPAAPPQEGSACSRSVSSQPVAMVRPTTTPRRPARRGPSTAPPSRVPSTASTRRRWPRSTPPTSTPSPRPPRSSPTARSSRSGTRSARRPRCSPASATSPRSRTVPRRRPPGSMLWSSSMTAPRGSMSTPAARCRPASPSSATSPWP